MVTESEAVKGSHARNASQHREGGHIGHINAARLRSNAEKGSNTGQATRRKRPGIPLKRPTMKDPGHGRAGLGHGLIELQN